MARKLPKTKKTAPKAGRKPAAKAVASGKKATAVAAEATASAAKGNGAANGNAALGDNTESRAKLIADTISDLHRLDGEINDLVTKHVKPKRDLKRKMIRMLKADTGIPRQILDAELRLYAIAQKTSEIDDTDHRQLVFEQMTEVHAALHPGQTVDFAKMVERVEAV